MTDEIILALPSKGAIAEPTRNFLRDCGLTVYKPNPRQYVGNIPAIPAINVLFQRVKDVVYKVADGTVQLGITGYDVVYEHNSENIVVIHDQLGFGHCKLVVSVPEAWIDVETMADLAEVATDFRERKGRNLRIATTYTNSTRRFLHSHHIHHFTLVRAEGAIEAAPTIGHADIIVDITQTGTTLRENHLKIVRDGIITSSQASLIGNRTALLENRQLLEIVRVLLEYIDGAQTGRKYFQVNVNMFGENAETVARQVAENPLTKGLSGPTIAPVYNVSFKKDHGLWHAVTITILRENLLPAIEHLRAIGGKQIVVSPARYVFMENSPTFEQLLNTLDI